MTVKVSDVMRYVRNHFILSSITGSWMHTGGALTPSERFVPGMWIAVWMKMAAFPIWAT